MKLSRLTSVRSIPSCYSLMHFKTERNMASTAKNSANVCANNIKVGHDLNSSLHHIDSQELFSIADLVKESKVLLENNSNIDNEEVKSTLLSTILSEVLDENSFLESMKLKESCTTAEVKDSGFSKRKQSGKTSLPGANPKKAAQNDSSAQPFTVSIEGNIGSGKSTFLKHFADMPMVATYQEPLGKWTDVGGYNLLGKLYEDPKRWSFVFQSYVQLTRLHIHLQRDENASVKLIERSLHNNRYCFVESGHDSGDLHSSEYDVLCEYFDVLNENLDLEVDLIVYLRSSPEVVHRRMQERGRAEEAGVPLAYLQKLHSYYERWLMEGKPCPPPAPVLVIDADSDLLTVIRAINSHQRLILGQEAFPGQVNGLENKQKENKDPSKENLRSEKQRKLKNKTDNMTEKSHTEIK